MRLNIDLIILFLFIFPTPYHINILNFIIFSL